MEDKLGVMWKMSENLNVCLAEVMKKCEGEEEKWRRGALFI